MAMWRAENPEKERAKNSAWAKANPRTKRAQRRRWAKANTDKVAAKNARDRANNPEKFRERGRRYRKANPAKMKQFGEARRARKAGAPGCGVSAAEWQRVLDDSLGLCAYCNERRPLTMDHVVPLVSGGAHDVENVVAACGPCNQSKGTRPLLVWLAWRAMRNQKMARAA